MPEDRRALIARRAGWGITALVTLLLVANALFMLLGQSLAPETLRQMVEEGGYQVRQAPLIGLITLLSAIVYVIPRTAVLGAILITGFFGGAVATEVRIGGSPWIFVSLAIGAMAWGALYLRDARVGALLPLTH